MDQAKQILSTSGIQPSFQRLKIYQYLYNKKNHPSVEMIYKDLLPEIPTLSKTTVYNTMKLLLEKKLIMSITIEEDLVRFDADTSCHGHFKCRQCGTLVDFSFPVETSKLSLPKGFVPDDTHIYAWGKCAECSQKPE